MSLVRLGRILLPTLLTLLFIFTAKAQQTVPGESSSFTPESGQPAENSTSKSLVEKADPNYVVEAYRERRFRRVTHYISAHKELIASDAIILAGLAADAASSVHCQRYPKYCIETEGLLGQHPDQLNTWVYAMGLASGMVALDHLAWHFAPEKSERHVIWFSTGAIGVSESWNVWQNVQSTQRVQACYRSGICK